ncbi:FecR domain-containing protein [Phenylobacterium sp.]|uniref:FecR family protein n=1 Tax=Phenylobacterium sp. TaxID=1871053 RepID=UPI0035B202DA
MSSPGDREERARLEAAGLWRLRLDAGDLAPDERAELEAWLQADPANAEAFGRASAVAQALDQIAASPELTAMRRRAVGSIARPRLGRGRRASVGWAVAAAVLLMLGAGVWVWLAPTRYATAVGERQVVVLGDGSRLNLDGDSRVDVRLRPHRRELWLRRGRATFTVAKDPLRPFSVAAGGRVVVATGTEFSVELLRQDVRVVLFQGQVAVLHDAGGPKPAASASSRPHRRDELTLRPGQELIASTTADEVKIAPADPARARAWETGQLIFDDEPLGSAVERLNRYSAEQLSIGDAAAAQVRVSGVFAAGDTAAFVTGVTTVWPVRAEPTEDGGWRFVSVDRG